MSSNTAGLFSDSSCPFTVACERMETLGAEVTRSAAPPIPPAMNSRGFSETRGDIEAPPPRRAVARRAAAYSPSSIRRINGIGGEPWEMTDSRCSL